MDKTKTREITLRAFAVVIACILWFIVTTIDNPERQAEISNIPVKLVNVESLSDAGLIMLSDADDYTIKLTVRGRSKDVLALTPADFKVEANVADGYRVKGVNSIPVELKEWPKDLIQIPSQPVYISVELDELVERHFPINIKVEGQPKEGYTSLPASIKPQEVILKGAAKYIGRVNSVVAKVDINGSYTNVQTSMPVQILDKGGNAVLGVECIPKTVDLTVPVKRAKEVPINIETTGNLPEGVFMMGMSATPTKITITGEERLVNQTKSIDTVPINLSTINSSTVRWAKLDLPPGIMLVEAVEGVNVDITVENTIDKTFNVQVDYINLPGELNAELLTNTISVTLSARESIINTVVASQITAEIDLKDAPQEDGEYEYTPTVVFPPELELKLVDPDKIKVKITKKQG